MINTTLCYINYLSPDTNKKYSQSLQPELQTMTEIFAVSIRNYEYLQ